MKLLEKGAKYSLEWYKENWKRLAVSSLITFLSGMALVLLQEIDNITIESFRDGSVLGIVFAGARLGVKMLLELFVNKS